MTLQTVSDWRIDIARKAAGVYMQFPAVAAIMLIGGLARGRGDRYSDVDLACFWLRPPLADERRAGLNQLETALAMPTALSELSTQRAFEGEHGLLWEETAYIGVSAETPFNRAAQIGFKIDINHRTVAAMEQILTDVVERLDGHGHKQEVLYSIPHVIVFHGAPLAAAWGTRAQYYPDALRDKLLREHLAALDADFAAHIYREDLTLFYQRLADAQLNLIAALFALNRVYRPGAKRLRDLLAEPKNVPPRLHERLNAMFRTTPAETARNFDSLVEEVFTLAAHILPAAEIATLREMFYTRRTPFDAPPV